MAAASALVSPPMDGMVTVTQRGFVVKAGGAAAPPALKSTSAGSLAEPSLLSLGSFGRRTVSPLLTPPASGSLESAAAGGDAGELHLAQCAKLTPGAKRLIKGVVRGLRAWQEPEAAAEGFGGTYFFRDEDGARCGIMKPCDEEPLAPNNPKGFVGRQLGDPGLKPTVRVGEAATREVAAYLLDRGHFSRVPHTVMVEISHPIFHVAPREEGAPAPPPTAASSSSSSLSSGATAAPVPESAEPASHPPRKLGSLQAFVAHECDTSELGASRFPVRDVHRIGILDIRLFNTDRHAGNILVRRVPSGVVGGAGAAGAGSPCPPPPPSCPLSKGMLDRGVPAYELVPIDHGFALPEELEPPYFEWQHWPQAMMPFGREELEYIRGLLHARPRAGAARRTTPATRPGRHPSALRRQRGLLHRRHGGGVRRDVAHERGDR
ncbi:hypothetical protein ACKKBG_A37730 [Auxenochlorella protothecoides x Auxenochlorella symbiontica]